MISIQRETTRNEVWRDFRFSLHSTLPCTAAAAAAATATATATAATATTATVGNDVQGVVDTLKGYSSATRHYPQNGAM